MGKEIMKNLFTIRQFIAATTTALLLLAGHCAHAIDYVWTNTAAALPDGTAGYWDDATSWSPNGVPSINDTASLTGVSVIYSGVMQISGINLTNSYLNPV
jgi:hypothetical protein